MAGHVVRGVAGNRSQYRPIESALVTDSAPSTVARAFHGLGFREAYVADLDAIAGAEPDWNAYAAIQAAGLRDLYVDAGVVDISRGELLASARSGLAPLAAVVAGLESLASPAALANLARAVGPQRVLFSLDLKGGQPLASGVAWQGATASDIAELALAHGVCRMLVLDLADVGTASGTRTDGLVQHIRSHDPSIEIWTGGGVRDRDDLLRQRRAGVAATLVASALHDGRLGPVELTGFIPPASHVRLTASRSSGF